MQQQPQSFIVLALLLQTRRLQVVVFVVLAKLRPSLDKLSAPLDFFFSFAYFPSAAAPNRTVSRTVTTAFVPPASHFHNLSSLLAPPRSPITLRVQIKVEGYVSWNVTP